MMNKAISKVNWRSHVLGSIALFVSLTVFLSSFYLHNSAKSELRLAERSLMQIKEKKRFAGQEMEVFNEYYPLYVELQERGVIGKTQRLQWLEVLQSASDKIKVPSLEFTIDQTRIAEDGRDHYVSVDVKTEITPMEISIKMVHEGDWINIFRMLQLEAKGVFSVEECKLNNQNIGEENAYLHGFFGSCKLEWYTLADITEDWPQ